MPSFVNQVSGDQGLATSHSRSYTPGAGVNLVIAILAVSGSITGQSITYGGVAMNMLDFVSGTQQIYVYYIVNPPAGASTVTANWTTSRNSTLAIRGYKDVNTVSPFGTVSKNTGNSGTPTTTVTSNPTELVIDAACGTNNLAVGAGQSQEFNTTSNLNAAGSREVGAASVTMSWSMPSSVWVIIAVPIRPQASFFLMFDPYG